MNALQQAFGTSLMAAEKLELASVRSTDKEWNSKKFDRTVASVCRGLWISDVAEPAFAEMRDDQGRTILQVSVRGYATDAMENKVATQAFAGSCSDPSCYSRIYDEGERLFLRFMAGEDGYLFVILEDPQEQSAFFLQSGSAAPARVTANSELRIPDARSDDYYQDIQLTLNSAHTNKRQYLWYVYSTRAPVLPMLNSQPGAVPVLDNSIFHSWLLRTMTRDDSVQVIWTPITINPAPSNE